MNGKINIEKYPEVLTPKHIQEILDIGERQTYELLLSKPFHYVRVGRMYKISRETFFKWLNGS
ncbi:helix-turn-helix domain-containing protein [Chengkuizengella sp. SCS-71B]|uniref:helix-turn-helix domain-containing protein n=1 Tax=Chengkuizengella sp. SCS-71B TaxID=3115290 RepID=UPI0032C22882